MKNIETKSINLKEDIDKLYEYLPSIDRVYLFGSRAYGTNSTRSDIDLIVVGDGISNESILHYHGAHDYLDIFIATPKSKCIVSPVTGARIERRGILSLYKQLDAKLLWSKKHGYLTANDKYLNHDIYQKQSFFASAMPCSEQFAALKKEINNIGISDECRVYLNESLASYTLGCYTACVAMLGCAYESLINDLIAVCEKKNKKDKADGNPYLATFDAQIRDNHYAKQRMENIRDYLNRDRAFYKSKGFDKIDERFAMFDLIRQYRNNADHPSAFEFTKEYCEVLFAGTALHLDKVVNLINELKKCYS